MILLFIFIICGLISSLAIATHIEIAEKGEEGTGIVAFFGINLIVILVWLGICCAFQGGLEKERQEQEKTEIYSIKNEIGITGHFVLGTGSVNSEMYYFYYTKGDYGYKIDKIKANDIEIVEREDSEQIGYIVKYKEVLKNDNYWVSFGKEVFFGKTKMVIYVPKGTIKIDYNVSV